MNISVFSSVHPNTGLRPDSSTCSKEKNTKCKLVIPSITPNKLHLYRFGNPYAQAHDLQLPLAWKSYTWIEPDAAIHSNALFLLAQPHRNIFVNDFLTELGVEFESIGFSHLANAQLLAPQASVSAINYFLTELDIEFDSSVEFFLCS